MRTFLPLASVFLVQIKHNLVGFDFFRVGESKAEKCLAVGREGDTVFDGRPVNSLGVYTVKISRIKVMR